MKGDNVKKVIIIGAGLSGLTAANEILKVRGESVQVTVIEAMDRVGGRTCSIQVEGARFDLGAEWVGNSQKHVVELVNESGNKLIPQYQGGLKVLQLGKDTSMTTSDIPTNVSYLALAEMFLVLWRMDRMVKSVPLDNPALCKNAIEWDSQTLASWINRNIWFQKIKDMLHMLCRGLICAESNQVSVLFFLWSINQAGGLKKATEVKDGPQQFRLLHGSQFLSEYLKQEVEKKGGKIILKGFVNRIQNQEQKCRVSTFCGQSYEGDYCIIALPPCNASKIQFLPDLSKERRLINRKNIMSSCVKMVLLYKEAYWRNKGFNGEVFTDCSDSPLQVAMDGSKPDPEGNMQHAIIVLMNGGVLREWAHRQNWKEAILQKLSQIFNCEEMKSPSAIHFKNWEQEETIDGGGYSAYFPPGTLIQIQDLRRPEGRLHWAGTEMASISQGYMDGAIQSGKRTAKEVLDRFQNHNNLPNTPQKMSAKKGFYYNQIVGKKL